MSNKLEQAGKVGRPARKQELLRDASHVPHQIQHYIVVIIAQNAASHLKPWAAAEQALAVRRQNDIRANLVEMKVKAHAAQWRVACQPIKEGGGSGRAPIHSAAVTSFQKIQGSGRARAAQQCC